MTQHPGPMHVPFSVNKEVKKYISKKLGKIAPGGSYQAFNENWEAIETDISELSKHVQDGHGLCAWHILNGVRKREETICIKAGLIIIDIDNQDDKKDADGNKVQKQELDINELDSIELCQKYLSCVYYSPSNTKEWPRFRLVFVLEKPIIDADFYQWFTRFISDQIPGSDKRATQVPNLFYGCKNPKDLIKVTDKYIPSSKIDEAFAHYSQLEKVTVTKGVSSELLEVPTRADGVDLRKLVSATVAALIAGEEPDDRSFSMALALKELIGWANWLRANDLLVSEAPLDIANLVFENVYQYSPELDNKFDRILQSITDAESLLPAVALAAENSEAAIWKKVRFAKQQLYDLKCPEDIKDSIRKDKPKPVNSVLSVEDFTLNETQNSVATTPDQNPVLPNTTSNQQQTMANQAPGTPAQLIQLQQNNGQFSENDIAEIIVTNYGDTFLFDSSLDEFFTYDDDEGIWFINDEQHIKRRIVKTLDTFIRAGVLQRYNSATVNSVFQILKAKLLRSVRGGRVSIWQSNRGLVAFQNGVLDTKTLQFEPGNKKDLYFQTKLGFKYSDDPRCPKFLSWLEWAVGKDKVCIVQAFCRAVLTGYTTGEKFLHLIGAGGSGKSTLQQILIALAGFTGTHTSDLETIETNRFEAHSLIGKRLLLLTDEASFSKRLDTLKKLTSASDTLRAERKYGTQVINFKPELLVSIASNEHISSSDISSGLERRRLTLVMNNVIEPSKRRNLLSVFSDRIEGDLADELPNIAAWVLSMPFDAMRDTLANPVKYCPNLNSTNIEALLFNNPIVAWLAECCLYAPNSHAVLGGGAFRPTIDEQERGLYVKNAFNEVYASYVNFAKSNGYKAAAKPRFVDRLKETVSNVLQIPNIELKFTNGKAVVKGIRLRPFDPSTDRACSGDTRLPSPIEYAADSTIWSQAFEAHDKPQS